MNMGNTKRVALSVILCSIGVAPATGQSEVKVSGLFYMDYEYAVDSPDSNVVGENGFRYRRMYLTADYDLSEKFSGRTRLEAQTTRLTNEKPFAFVKDLWLKWKGVLGDDHDVIIGVQSPPSYVISETEWGYRSLAATIMDRNFAVVSRDFGVQLMGMFGKDSPLGYGIMFANNSGVIGEANKGKRVYGQLSFTPTERITLTAGADYATNVPFVDEGLEANRANANAFASYDAGKVRVGVEAYYRSTNYKNTTREDFNSGLSVWVVAKAGKTTELIGRVDRVGREIGGRVIAETLVLTGVAFLPQKNVHFIPNILFTKFDSDDNPTVLGRITLHADF